MLEEICIIFITILTCSLAFNLSCPGSGQWNYRAVFYCSDLNKYTCLLDTSKTRYSETCDGSRKETEGYKSTINRNNFDTAKCRPDRFQPKDFITVGHSDCVFQKSKCAQEGQIAAHEIKEKTSLLDTNCLCDYKKGYSFIYLPKDKCFCSPLVDDCSCFREFCPSGKILSPDYQCTSEIDMKNRKWNCSNITFAGDGQNGDQVGRYTKNNDPRNGRLSRIAVQVIVLIVMIVMVAVLIWYWKTSKLENIKERIKRLVYGKNDHNDSEAVFIPTEIPLTSDKNETELELYGKNDHNNSEAVFKPTEIPLTSDKNETQLESTLSRLSIDSITSVHDNCPSTKEIKLLQTDYRTTDISLQTKQNDSSVPEHDDTGSDNISFKSAHEFVTAINEIEDKKRVSYNSTGTSTKSEMSELIFQNGEKESDKNYGTLQKDQSDKGDDAFEDSCTIEDENEMTSTKDIGDQTEESDEENCTVEAEENKIKKNEELSTFAKEQKDKCDDPVAETCTVFAYNEMTSPKQNKEKSDGSGEEICTDEAKYNTIKENGELNTHEKANTDNEPFEEIATLGDEIENSEEYSKLDSSEKEHRNTIDKSDDDICIDEAENILKVKENEELNTSEQDNTYHSDESDEKKCDTDNKKRKDHKRLNNTSEEDNTDNRDESNAKKSDTDNKKPSAQDNTDDNDELDAEKYDTENKKLSKSGTDNQDKRVNRETPNVTENATEENFDILLKGLEESKHESVDSGSDEIFDSKNPKSND